MTTGIFSLMFIATIKYLGIPVLIFEYFGLDYTKLGEYMLAGFFGLIFRLGIKSLLGDTLCLPYPEYLIMGDIDPNPNISKMDDLNFSKKKTDDFNRRTKKRKLSWILPGIKGPNGTTCNPNNPGAPNVLFYLPEEQIKRKEYVMPEWPGPKFERCPSTNKYIMKDPTNIRSRGYMNEETGDVYFINQPYLSNIAAALQNDTDTWDKSFDETKFFPEDIKYWRQYQKDQLERRKRLGTIPETTTELLNTRLERLRMSRHP